MLMKRIGEHIMANLIQENKHLEERLDSHRARLYTLENLDIPQQMSKAIDEIVTDAIDWAIQAPLRNRFRDLPEADMKEIHHQRIWETNSYKTHKDHMMLYEALEKSIYCDHSEELLKDLAEARKKKKKRRDSPKTPPGSPPHQPPPPPPPAGPSGALGSPKASGSSPVLPPPLPPPSTNQEDLQMNDDMATDAQAQSSDDEDIGNANIPKVNLRQDWWKPLKEDIPATPEPAWSIPSSDVRVPKNNWASALAITELKPQDLEDPAFELVKVFHPNVIHIQYQMEECHKLLTDSVDDSIIRHNVSKPLPQGGPPDQMKAAYYPDVGLEKIVPDQMWIEEECKYDIAAIIEVFSMYGYNYMNKIVLRRADLNEHVITERYFKYLYPSDFEDLYFLNLQGKKSRNQFLALFMNISKLTSAKPCYLSSFTYPTGKSRFNEIHKFSDGTLHQIDEALDYRVKEFKVNRMNLGLNTRFWTTKDVDKSKEFMFSIQKRLKTMRIFRNLKSFVGRRVRDEDYRLLKRTE
uniref:Uncharacterized protein n=1 Tax=Tanacetum cinerariifolium TaxID=118510 RepID=A0A699GTE0_TANCI|nr:hypothetical protein [Tanacetum cinerariifolium]